MAGVFLKDVHPSAGSDWLTGLPARGNCLSLLAAELEHGEHPDSHVAAIWLNIDRFRQINNSFGHIVGDSVLVEFARRLRRAMPLKGELARVGGDEFVVILSGVSEPEANRIARSLQAALSQPLGVGTQRLRPSVSIGIALAGPEDDASAVLERSDRAMSEAKREGGGRIVQAANQQHPVQVGKHLAREELGVEEMLHRALETGGLFLDYQPIIRVADGTAVAVEALMRCRVDDQIIPPGRFIPVAEKTGLISHLGDWSLVTAAEFIQHLNRQGLNLKVAVNVSRAQLLTPAFAKSLHGVLAYTGIAPEQMELEITESLFMDKADEVQKNLHAALEAGFPLALDDFGTGYSSLACLKDLPASKIKLDRAFVVDLPNDTRSICVAKAVSRLAADLGITIVAEGVETAEQYECLCQAGVTAIQGFYLARPMGELELQKWLSA
jgi:diguanylate cyclase (GGDEF)-like protein